MKINLRKASIVQDLLHDEVCRLGSEPTIISVNLFEDNLCEQVDQQRQEFEQAQAKIEIYLEARRVLRTLVAKHNVTAGVHDLLSEDAMLASMEQRQKIVVKHSETRLSDEAIKRQAESMRNLDDYATTTMKLNVLPAESLQRLKDKTDVTKRRRRKIKDKLLIINVTTELEVPTSVATVIKELGLD